MLAVGSLGQGWRGVRSTAARPPVRLAGLRVQPPLGWPVKRLHLPLAQLLPSHASRDKCMFCSMSPIKSWGFRGASPQTNWELCRVSGLVGVSRRSLLRGEGRHLSFSKWCCLYQWKWYLTCSYFKLPFFWHNARCECSEGRSEAS